MTRDPTDRPRARPLVGEEHHAASGVTYRTYADGHVVTYVTDAPTGGVTDRTRWRADVWTANPLLNRRARLVRSLVTGATWAALWRRVAAWEHEEEP